MIVNEDDRGRVFGDCLAKNLAWMNERRVEQTACHRDVALESVLRIENRNVEFLDGKILKALAEYFVDIARTTHRHALIPFFSRHPPAELEGGVDRDRPCVADTGKTRPG